MTSTYNYDDTVKISVISGKDFNSNKTPQQIEEKLIPCTHIKKFTVDTLLYLHIHNGLYLSLLNYNQINNNNIQQFDNCIKNLKIKIDTTTSNPTYMYEFNDATFTYTFYLENFKVNFKNDNNQGYKNYTINDNKDDINKHKPLLTNVNTLIGSSLSISSGTDDTEVVFKDTTATNIKDITFSKSYISQLLTSERKDKTQYLNDLNTSNTRLNKLKTIIFDILYTESVNIQSYLKYFTNYYHLILYNISIQVSLRTFYLNAKNTAGTSYNITNFKFGSGATINAAGIKKIYKYTMSLNSGGSGFQVGDVIELNTADGDLTPKASAVVATVTGGVIATLKDITPGYSSSYDGTGTPIYTYKRNGDVITPTPTEPTITPTKDAKNYIYIPLTNKGSSYYISPTTINQDSRYSVASGGITYNFKIDTNTFSIQYIIGESTAAFTIGNSGTPTITAATEPSFTVDTYNTISGIPNVDKLARILFAIEDNIHKMNNNINELIYRLNDGNELIDEYTPIKSEMIETIKQINSKKDEKKKYQDDVNYKIRLYNDHTKNFKDIKKYANYVIYFLIFVIALTLILSIIPTVSSNVKFTYYIITIILLFIFTFLYYTNFKDIHYENEKFEDYMSHIITASPSPGTCLTSVITYTSSIQGDRDKHAFIINRLTITLNNYYKTYNNYTQIYRTLVTTIGSDVFTKNTGELLYEIYLTNVKQIDLFKIKKVELANSIEIIKRQIIYLFNVILFISLFTIILILALLLYTIVPTMMISIISLCVILLIIVITYFTVVLSYPTRMIADKNYWAIHNPSKYTLSKIS